MVEWLMTWSGLDGLHRHMVARVLGRTDPEFMTAGQLAAVHISSVLMDFVRGAVVTAVGLVVGGWLSGFLASRWPLPYETTMALILIGASVHLGALLRGFGGWRSRRAVFLVGLVAGIVGAYL